MLLRWATGPIQAMIDHGARSVLRRIGLSLAMLVTVFAAPPSAPRRHLPSIVSPAGHRFILPTAPSSVRLKRTEGGAVAR